MGHQRYGSCMKMESLWRVTVANIITDFQDWWDFLTNQGKPVAGTVGEKSKKRLHGECSRYSIDGGPSFVLQWHWPSTGHNVLRFSVLGLVISSRIWRRGLQLALNSLHEQLPNAIPDEHRRQLRCNCYNNSFHMLHGSHLKQPKTGFPWTALRTLLWLVCLSLTNPNIELSLLWNVVIHK